ncbi:MAG TPA: hypothetical protein VLB50_02200 [Ignavibacteriaceae bacterium]|nr:hypothetical protein [Ignavibacteriaceae bacterium]
MNRVKQFQFAILTFILLFFIAATLLRLIGLLTLYSTELFGYAFILYGIATVYTTFGENYKVLLFAGAAIFLIGILISLPAHFDIIQISNLYIPSAILIGGISLFVVYFDDTTNPVVLIASIILLLSGIILVIVSRTVYVTIFLESILDFIAVYWPVLLIVSGITIILRR